MAKKIDESLYHDTKLSLMSAASDNPELIDLVEEQLQDMKETGYFDLRPNQR